MFNVTRGNAMHTLKDFTPGQRVQTHPATNAWMRGDRFGTVTSICRKHVRVHLDKSDRAVFFLPQNLIPQ